MHDYLKNKFQANEENLKLLTDDQAKKADIIDAISSIAKRADARNESIIFFFSGYSSRTKSEDDEQEGILCPVDVLDEGGLSDSLLLQLFDQVAKSCGNNIVRRFDAIIALFVTVITLRDFRLLGLPVKDFQLNKSSLLRCCRSRHCEGKFRQQFFHTSEAQSPGGRKNRKPNSRSVRRPSCNV